MEPFYAIDHSIDTLPFTFEFTYMMAKKHRNEIERVYIKVTN